MTAKEAIEQIQYRIDTATQMVGKGQDGKAYEDLKMAITALKNFGQCQWERDVALEQLNALGLSLGEKIDDAKQILENNKQTVRESVPFTFDTNNTEEFVIRTMGSKDL